MKLKTTLAEIFLLLVCAVVFMTPGKVNGFVERIPAALTSLSGQDSVKLLETHASGLVLKGSRAASFYNSAATSVPNLLSFSSNLPPAGLPIAFDLTKTVIAPPARSQEQVNSCTSWALAYMRGFYARRAGNYPLKYGVGGFAPMFLYAQLVNGQNVGTTFASNLNLMQAEGIDPRFDYSQGSYDYLSLPTTDEKTVAARYKISGWKDLPTGPKARESIERAISSGDPVAIGFPIYPAFEKANAKSFNVDVPRPGDASLGNHAVWSPAYDEQGLWVENSWGTNWGMYGWVKLSWAFVQQYAFEIVTITPGGN